LRLTISGSTLLKLACTMSLAITFLPAVDYYCPWFITAIPVFVVLYVTLKTDSNIYPLVCAGFLILILGILSYWVIYRDNSITNYFINFFIAFIPCICAIQLGRTVNNADFFLGYLRTVVIFTGITCITTILGLQVYPMASRELASGTAIYDTTRYLKANIGGYEFIYALILLIPVLVWMITHSDRLWAAISVIVLVLDVLCIYESQYTIALVCTVIVFLTLLFQFNKSIGYAAITVFGLFLLLNGFSGLSKMFYWASDVVGQEYVSDRLLQVSQLFSGNNIHTYTTEARINHYRNQINAFLASPGLGHNLIVFDSTKISGHSFLLDVLGGAGIIGFFTVCGLSRKLYSMTVNLQKNRSIPHVHAVWIMVICIAVLNPVFFPIILTVVSMCCVSICKTEK